MRRSRGMHIIGLLMGAIGLAAGCAVKESPSDDSARGDTAPVPAAAAPDAAAADTVPPGPDVPASPGRPEPAAGGTRSPSPAAPARSEPAAPVAKAPPQAPRDTIRGMVAEVGSQPMVSVVVRPSTGRSVTILGPLAMEIRRAAGAEVWVGGVRSAAGLEATRYALRTVDGQAAVDGTLAADGDRLVLVTPSGRRPIARPPQALRGMIGARVWLVGPLDGTIASYGVLREPPK